MLQPLSSMELQVATNSCSKHILIGHLQQAALHEDHLSQSQQMLDGVIFSEDGHLSLYPILLFKFLWHSQFFTVIRDVQCDL